MVSGVTIFLGAALAGMIRETYKRATGREMFKANPKGPLYRWLGPKETRPNHVQIRARLEKLRRDQATERTSERLLPPPERRFRVTKRKP